MASLGPIGPAGLIGLSGGAGLNSAANTGDRGRLDSGDSVWPQALTDECSSSEEGEPLKVTGNWVPLDSNFEDWAQNEDPSEAGFMRLGKYFRLYRALARAPEKRTPRDLIEIRQALDNVSDLRVRELEESVKQALVQRLTFEEFGTGEEIFNYGDPGNKLFIFWSGEVQTEVPQTINGVVVDGPELELVKDASFKGGLEAGQLALFTMVKKRKMRLTAIQPTQLFALTEEDFIWCMAFSQEHFERERIDFLRTADRASLGDVHEEDLKAMAAYFSEERHTGGQVVLKQGEEVNRILWVKSGFCKVIRQLDQRFSEAFDLHTVGGTPPPNPFAPTIGQFDDASDELLGPGAREFRRILQRHHVPTPRRDGRSPPSSRRPVQVHRPPVLPSAATRQAVVLDVLQQGQSFGVMELMEGLANYQCSLIADPWVDVYVISKHDLIFNTSRSILHKLSGECKARLTDERIVQRLKQYKRWNNYKRGLLADIRDREPRPHLAGMGDLRPEDYKRIGEGERLWDKRAQTPPKQKPKPSASPSELAAGMRVQLVGLKKHVEMNGSVGTLLEQKETTKWLVRLDNDETDRLFKAKYLESVDEVQFYFDIKVVVGPDGRKGLAPIEWECRDGSMIVLENCVKQRRGVDPDAAAGAVTTADGATEDKHRVSQRAISTRRGGSVDVSSSAEAAAAAILGKHATFASPPAINSARAPRRREVAERGRSLGARAPRRREAAERGRSPGARQGAVLGRAGQAVALPPPYSARGFAAAAEAEPPSFLVPKIGSKSSAFSEAETGRKAQSYNTARYRLLSKKSATVSLKGTLAMSGTSPPRVHTASDGLGSQKHLGLQAHAQGLGASMKSLLRGDSGALTAR